MNKVRKAMQELAKIINEIKITVTPDHHDLLKREYQKNTYSSSKNVDALLLELHMKNFMGFTTLDTVSNESYQWRHDIMYKNLLIDLKRRPKWSQNISLSKLFKLKESFNMGQLTHIVCYSQNKEHNYSIGDRITFKFEGWLPVMDAINESIPKSNYNLLSKSKFIME